MTMTRERDPRCPQCGAEFASDEEMAAHHRQAHLVLQDETFRCEACGLAFLTREQLEAHSRQFHSV
jgi:uncharacterized C2H2 Zn-finger protein